MLINQLVERDAALHEQSREVLVFQPAARLKVGSTSREVLAINHATHKFIDLDIAEPAAHDDRLSEPLPQWVQKIIHQCPKIILNFGSGVIFNFSLNSRTAIFELEESKVFHKRTFFPFNILRLSMLTATGEPILFPALSHCCTLRMRFFFMLP